MRRTITFRQKHFELLKNHLLREDGKEHVAFLLFGKSFIEKDPWTGEQETRLLCRELDLVSDEDLVRNKEYQITWDNNRFLSILKQAEGKDYGVGIIHSHPGGFNSFSDIDDENEKRLFQLAFNRNGNKNVHASLVMTPPGEIIGRFWEPTLESYDINFLRILGERFKFQFVRAANYGSPDFLDRQKLAFGEALIEEVSSLRVGIVGCGATGSMTANLLARLGVGNLLLVDKDVVDVTNLNRLYGVTNDDVGKNKVEVLKKVIEKIGLGTNVRAITDWVSAKSSKNSLKACDIVFGCSDDNAGRILLNRLAYFYLIPLFDMGLTIHLTSTTPPQIQALIGRATFVFPGSRCLNSYGITRSDAAYAENLRRNEPDQYERLKKEAYVIGEGNPSPAIGTFTTETATMAVNEFLYRLQGFRNSGAVDQRLRFFHLDEDIKPSSEPESDCRICGSSAYWGRGDMQPFLDMV